MVSLFLLAHTHISVQSLESNLSTVVKLKSYSAGIEFRRQNLTSTHIDQILTFKVNPRTVGVKYV